MLSLMLILLIFKKFILIEKLLIEDWLFWKFEYRIIIYFIGDEFFFV